MDRETASVIARRLVESGADPESVVEQTFGAPSFEENAATALERDRESLPFLRDLVLSPPQGRDLLQLAAVRALSHWPEERPLLRAVVQADDYPARARAIDALAGDEALQPLFLNALTHISPNVQAAAVRAVGSLPEARPALLAILEGGAKEESAELRSWKAPARAAAARALAGDPAAHAPLLRLAAYPDTRDAALEALSRDAQGRAFVFGWLEHGEPAQQAAAARALASDESARPAIHRLLEHSAADVRLAAVGALAEDESARPALARLLFDENQPPGVRARVLELGSAVTGPVAELLLHSEPWIRGAAARYLAGDAASSSTRLGLLSDKNESVRIAAIEGLSGEARAREALVKMLSDKVGVVRAAAIQALAGDVALLPRIEPLARDPDPYARRAAFAALARHERTLPLVRRHLRPDLREVRRFALSALAEQDAHRPALLALLKHPETRVRDDAIEALSRQAWARNAIVELAEAGTPAAIEALGDVPEMRPRLRPLLSSRDDSTRGAAARALRNDLESRAAFKKLLKDRDFAVRFAAIEALSSDDSARAALQKLLRPNGVDAARAAAARALRTFPAAQADFSLLVESEDEEDPNVRVEALRALEAPPDDLDVVWNYLNDLDEEPPVRAEALKALSRWGTPREQLIRFAEDPTARVRAAFIETLEPKLDDAAVEPKLDDAAVDLVRAKLDDEHSIVRVTAAHALRAKALPTRAVPLAELRWVRKLRESEAGPVEAFVERPRRLDLDEEPDLGERLLGWLCERLVRRDRPPDSLFCTPETPTDADALESLDSSNPCVVIRLPHDPTLLAAQHGVFALHAVLEAALVARWLVARTPLSLWLLCANAPHAEIARMTLPPRGLALGPGVYGLRIGSSRS